MDKTVRLYSGTGCPLFAGIELFDFDTNDLMLQISPGYKKFY